jgi:Zn-dependent protease
LFRNYRIGSLLGIPLEVNPSWLVTLTFIIVILGGDLYPDALENEPDWFYWTLAGVSGVFFFGSIIIHELAHSLVARRFGIPVRSITLFMLGGVSQIARDAKRPLIEFAMAIVGPLTSFALAGVFLGLVYTPGLREDRSNVMWQLLFIMNASLGVVNMAPGFPMDGGRVLRAALWGITGSYRSATRWAALVGRAMGYLLIAGGLVVLLRLVPGFTPFAGIWFMLVGLFLETSARQSWSQVGMVERLRRHDAEAVMRRELRTVPETSSVLEAVSRHAEPGAGLCAFVVDLPGETVLGMLSDAETARVRKDRWPTTAAGTAMRPVATVATAAPDTDLATIVETMEATEQTHVPVVDEGRVVGYVSRARIAPLLLSDEERERLTGR